MKASQYEAEEPGFEWGDEGADAPGDEARTPQANQPLAKWD